MGRLVDADALVEAMNNTKIQMMFDLPVEELLGERVE